MNIINNFNSFQLKGILKKSLEDIAFMTSKKQRSVQFVADEKLTQVQEIGRRS